MRMIQPKEIQRVINKCRPCKRIRGSSLNSFKMQEYNKT